MALTIRHRRAYRIGVVLGLAAVLTGIVPAAPVEAASDRLPDLRSARIRDIRIVSSGGRRLLRFTSMMWNKGAGPFEVRSNRKNTSSRWNVHQIVYNDAGGFRRIGTNAKLRFAGDGHNHWHVRDMMSYHLWGSGGTLRDAKIGFCFFDTNLIDGDLPRSPSRRVYTESRCGGRSTLYTRTGISVGWGDRYPWNFAYQWIDISGMGSGTYTLRSAVDLHGHFDEKSETNNCSWAKIRFKASGTSVSVLDTGYGCINDYSSTPYAAAVVWARANGISKGCDVDLYCTYNPVNRGALAALLARAMDLPSTSKDFFDDDDETTHESSINRLAAAGLAIGCGTRRFCPGRIATRATGAAFMARALDLEPVEEDYFTDDETSPDEAAINMIAAAGIATACATNRYCPTSDLSRGVFTLYLYRAFATD